MPVLEYLGKIPRIDPSSFVAENATVIGEVTLGEESSLWFNVVVRADVNAIRIGKRTNIQDGSVIHVTRATHPTFVGNGVTVGHRAVLHGCTIEDGCLIGIGAILLDGARIGSGSIIAAGAVVAPGTVIPPGTLAMGAPARPKRELREEEKFQLVRSAENYVVLQKNYQRKERP